MAGQGYVQNSEDLRRTVCGNGAARELFASARVGGYWYHLASAPLVLDHLYLSVTLKLPFLNSRGPRRSLPRVEEDK